MIENGRALYLIMSDVEPDWEEEFNSWYDEVHLPGALTIPGFIRGRRFLNLLDGPKYLALYDLETPSVPASSAYAEHVSKRTQRDLAIIPHIIGTPRQLYVELGPRSDGQWSSVHLLRELVGRTARPDRRGALELLSPNVRVEIPASLPYGGIYEGHEAYLRLLEMLHQVWEFRDSEGDSSYIANNDGVAIRRSPFRARSRATGRHVDLLMIEIVSTSQGKIDRIEVVYSDTAVMVGAITP